MKNSTSPTLTSSLMGCRLERIPVSKGHIAMIIDDQLLRDFLEI